MPRTPAPPPHAAFTPGHSPQSGQQAHHPYLFQGQTATPTQPVAPHLSSIGQPAKGLIPPDGSASAPPAAIPPATPSPNAAPTPPHSWSSPHHPPAHSGPQPVTGPQARPVSHPWGRDRMAALVLTLLAVGIHVIWTVNDTSAHPAFPSLRNATWWEYSQALQYIPNTLGAWWLILLLVPVITITRNQASTITTAAALQLFFVDTLILNNSPIGNPLPILCLLLTGGAAIFTTLMGRTTTPPRHWPVNLGMAVNLFLLVTMAHRLMKTYLFSSHHARLSDHVANVWMAPSSAKLPGIPIAAGITIMIIVAAVASISLYLGFSRPTSRAFLCTVGVAPTLMALVNMYILSVFGLSGAITLSGLGLTSVGAGTHPHAEFRAWMASILLALLAIGVTAVLRRRTSVVQHTPASWRTAQTLSTGAPAFGAATPTYAGGPQTYPPGVSGITPLATSVRPSAPNSW